RACRNRQPRGHPKGLYMLFFAEVWERFSFYGMRALLIFYLTQHWLFSQGEGTLILGAYGAMVYVTPVLGGWLADRYLGQRKAVLFGGILLAFGHLFMAVEGEGGQSDPALNVFWLALGLIIVGSGFLKANISVMVGQLYKRTDTRRDAAYTIFYMGINVGAAAGSILVGYLGLVVGWSYGFGLAGIGMVIGLIVFVLGRKALRGAGEAPATAEQGNRDLRRRPRRRCGDVGADAVPRGHPDAADRFRRRLARVRPVPGLQAAKGAARADLRDPVPDCAQSAVLGPVRP